MLLKLKEAPKLKEETIEFLSLVLNELTLQVW